MTGPKVSSSKESIAIGGDVHAPILNLNLTAQNSSALNLTIEQRVDRELPSHLGAVIVAFSRESLSQYGLRTHRDLPAEVLDKVKYNNLSQDHRALIDYYMHSLVLERAYLGVEQQCNDARYLVRRKAALAYNAEVDDGCRQNAVPANQKLDFVKANANSIVERVITRLVDDYKISHGIKVEQEYAHLAVSLIVVDAVVECEVLERPLNALTA